MTTLAWGAVTDTGRLRDVNQDGVFVADDVFVVADGMGGHRGGEVASAIVVEEMAKITTVSSTDELIEMVQRANREVLDRARSDPSLYGMGTTMVALVAMTDADSERLCVANVGDSRLYVRTKDEMLQLTDDHSLVEGMVRDGWISPEEAMVHPQRNVVTRALGVEDELLVDAWELLAVTGDRYLLCSDGLTNELSDAEILGILDETDDPAEAASSLVQAACTAGGRDNVTVVVVDVVDTESTEPDPPADRVVATHKAVPDYVDVDATNEATTDEATTDEATTDEATTDEATTDEATTDEATTDEATTDERQPTKRQPTRRSPTSRSLARRSPTKRSPTRKPSRQRQKNRDHCSIRCRGALLLTGAPLGPGRSAGLWP